MAKPVDMARGKVSHVLGRLAIPLMASLFFVSFNLGRLEYEMTLLCLRVPLANEFAARWGEQECLGATPTASACTALVAVLLLRHLRKSFGAA